jgi:hypothetical protein
MKRPMLRRPLLAIVCVASLVAILVATLTGGGASRRLGLDPVADAATHSLAARTASVHMIVRAAGKRLVLDGTMDNQHQRGEFHGDVPGVGTIREVFSGLTFYIRMPQLARELDGRHWLKMDMVKLGKRMGIDVGALIDPSSSDPSAPLEQLRRLGKSAQRVGRSRVLGEPAVHYRVTGTLQDFTNALPEKKRKAAIAALKRTQDMTGLRNEVAADVWVDRHNRIKRMAMGYDVTQGHISMRIDFVRYDVPVSVKLPDPSDTVDALEVLDHTGEGE